MAFVLIDADTNKLDCFKKVLYKYKFCLRFIPNR